MNKDALEAGVPHRRVRNRSEGPRSSRSPVSSLEGPAAQRASTLSGILERRRAAERQMADVFSALPEPAERIPARVTGELGFILHAWDWSETSLLLDVLTVRYGRVFLVARAAPLACAASDRSVAVTARPSPLPPAARGARRASSQYRGLLTAFCPLRFSWTGSKEAKMLVRAEWQGTMVPLTGEALLSGFYVNELILKLTVREERHPGLFEAYVKAIHALALDERDAMQPALREFEMAVLKAAGWAPAFSDDGRSPWYCVRDGALEGLAGVEGLPEGVRAWPGALVREMLSGEPMSPAALRASRDILRTLIDFHLDGRSIHSRRILAELNGLQKT